MRCIQICFARQPTAHFHLLPSAARPVDYAAMYSNGPKNVWDPPIGEGSIPNSLDAGASTVPSDPATLPRAGGSRTIGLQPIVRGEGLPAEAQRSAAAESTAISSASTKESSVLLPPASRLLQTGSTGWFNGAPPHRVSAAGEEIDIDYE